MPHREPGERALPSLAEVPHPRGPRGKRAARRERARRVRERGDLRAGSGLERVWARRRGEWAEALDAAGRHRRAGLLDMARAYLQVAATFWAMGFAALP